MEAGQERVKAEKRPVEAEQALCESRKESRWKQNRGCVKAEAEEKLVEAEQECVKAEKKPMEAGQERVKAEKKSVEAGAIVQRCEWVEINGI